jgi:sec-independent protein translocase protein TatB
VGDRTVVSAGQAGLSWDTGYAGRHRRACLRPPLECWVFDLSLWKLLVLGVLALVIFGPERLPGMAAQAGRMLRELRRLAEGAKAELQEGLGPEFTELTENFDVSDLNPRHFVRKHVMNELAGTGTLLGGANGSGEQVRMPTLAPGESPPYDIEAT